MGLGIAAVQNILEMNNLGYFKQKNSVIEIGSQELHLKKNDLKELFDYAGLQNNLVDAYPDIDNWPNQPRCSSKYLYKSLGFKEYQSIDINSEHGATKHDLNIPFEDKSKFNKFNLVTDFGSCEHVFNISEAYKTMHKLTKPDGYIIIFQSVLNGNGYFLFDRAFFEGIAAANNYKIIFNSYILATGEKTKNGSDQQFHIPQNESIFNAINFANVENVSISAVFQKQNDNEFKIPYQQNLMSKIYGNSGFNRMYFKDPLSYSYIPSAKKTVEEVSFKTVVKEFFRRLLRKIKN